MKDYGNLSLPEIERLIEVNDMKLREIWDTDDGGSWEKYKKKCQPYWDDNEALYAAKSMKVERENIPMRPLSKLDKDCLVSIKTFKAWCDCGAVTSYDGCGNYATATEVSDLDADPAAFKKGIIREDFTHVCWYNK